MSVSDRQDKLLASRPIRARLLLVYVFLIAANIAAWGAAYLLFRDDPVMMGTASLAYVFGLRHAFDADHVAAIDNVVRKLMQEGRKPLGAGFFFSLGHSTIVVIGSALIAASAAAVQGELAQFHELGGVIGTLVSAFFLLAIGVANLIILKGVWAAFSRAKRGERVSDEELDTMLANRGFLARIFRPVFRVVTKSWHMYPVGFLFGLGFDTATEIGLLGISATQAAQGMSFWTIMIFPALFTAGMAFMDTTHSVAMVGAYGWAFINPIRKLWYNLTITAASVVVAIFIGGVEALGVVSDKLGLAGGFWDFIGEINDNLTNLGYAVVGIFMLGWVVSTVIYKLNRYDNLART
ncbi:HoxN/HupN/NixA family nickel/cobalt transporter [Mesorhizobium sp. M1295]|uniref:HoxN/HupN/NixA family nickel/cobalt transporter n=1 Tax=Mesorhizobium sp. M1295 TaxID=2957076 RepID=UPI003337787D